MKTVVDVAVYPERETTATAPRCHKRFVDPNVRPHKSWWVVICDKCYIVCNNESWLVFSDWAFGKLEYLEEDGTIADYLIPPP